MNFKESFDSKIALVAGESCNWKKHFRGCAGQVIGYLDSKAKQNPIPNFAFARVRTIQEWCAKEYRTSEPYGLSTVEAALTFLSRLGIIQRINHVVLNGKHYRGFLVAPHDHACKILSGFCCFCCEEGVKLNLMMAYGGYDNVPGTRLRITSGKGKPSTAEFEVYQARSHKGKKLR